MIKGIIFDLDGTLVRLPIEYDLIFKKLKKLFDTNDEFKPLIPTILEKADNNTTLISQAFELICDEEIKSTKNFEIIQGTIEILEYFKTKNFLLGLVTMQCEKAAKSVLQSMNAYDYFSSIITRDESTERDTQIQITARRLSLLPKEILVIGDRIHDVKSAQKVGCKAILSNKTKLDTFNDSQVISSLLELKNVNLS